MRSIFFLQIYPTVYKTMFDRSERRVTLFEGWMNGNHGIVTGELKLLSQPAWVLLARGGTVLTE